MAEGREEFLPIFGLLRSTCVLGLGEWCSLGRNMISDLDRTGFSSSGEVSVIVPELRGKRQYTD